MNMHSLLPGEWRGIPEKKRTFPREAGFPLQFSNFSSDDWLYTAVPSAKSWLYVGNFPVDVLYSTNSALFAILSQKNKMTQNEKPPHINTQYIGSVTKLQYNCSEWSPGRAELFLISLFSKNAIYSPLLVPGECETSSNVCFRFIQICEMGDGHSHGQLHFFFFWKYINLSPWLSSRPQ